MLSFLYQIKSRNPLLPMDLPYPKSEEFDPGGLEQLGRRSRVAAVRVAVRYQENGFRRCWPTELSGKKF